MALLQETALLNNQHGALCIKASFSLPFFKTYVMRLNVSDLPISFQQEFNRVNTPNICPVDTFFVDFPGKTLIACNGNFHRASTARRVKKGIPLTEFLGCKNYNNILFQYLPDKDITVFGI